MENSDDTFGVAGGSTIPDCEQPLLSERPDLSSRPQGGILTIVCVPSITLVNCYLGGIITITIPDISIELGISPELELW
jgi:hypothetical protein